MDISYITNFILGGFLISSISWIALKFNSLIAAIWWSFPFTLIPSLIIAHSKGKSNAFLSKFMYGALYSAILLFISIDPDEGVSIKDIKFNKVDLPDPDGPTIE